MKGQAPIFSSGKDDWQTPSDLFAALHSEFAFTMDAAANAQNHLLPRWWGPDSSEALDSLTHWWNTERCWLNPPYSAGGLFVEKAARARLTGALTVMLVPSRTDTKWFHAHVWDRVLNRPQNGVEVRFLKGRLKFTDPSGKLGSNSAPFPSMVVVFRPEGVLS